MKTIFEAELQTLKDWDEVQYTDRVHGYDFIVTAGHGYLVVPAEHPQVAVARRICKYGFTGKLAVYLEEDAEAIQFLRAVGVF